MDILTEEEAEIRIIERAEKYLKQQSLAFKLPRDLVLNHKFGRDLKRMQKFR
jgi:hypothetical protein